MIALTTSLPASYYLLAFVNEAGLTLGDSAIYISGLVLTWLLTLIIIYVLYILMFALLRSPLINRFFVYTSLTYYWARYKAPEIGLKDFKRAKPPV